MYNTTWEGDHETEKTYTREFKIEAVRLLKRSGKSQTTVADELGISQTSLSRWKREFAEDGEDAFPGRGRLRPQEKRIRALEQENEILRQERDILKKAVTIFSQPSK